MIAMQSNGGLLGWGVSKISKNNRGYGFEITFTFQHENQSRWKGEFDSLKDAEKGTR